MTEWGLDGIARIRSVTTKPLVAIGNISAKMQSKLYKQVQTVLLLYLPFAVQTILKKPHMNSKQNFKMKKYTSPSVLTIAGFDGSGGAEIQADIKTFSALGCFATSVLTALPVQNTQGVRKIYSIPEQAVADQIEAILDDIFPAAIKIGMVHTPQLVDTIVNTLSKYAKIPIVFDPVMVATSGHHLIKRRNDCSSCPEVISYRRCYNTQYG